MLRTSNTYIDAAMPEERLCFRLLRCFACVALTMFVRRCGPRQMCLQSPKHRGKRISGPNILRPTVVWQTLSLYPAIVDLFPYSYLLQYNVVRISRNGAELDVSVNTQMRKRRSPVLNITLYTAYRREKSLACIA